MDEDAESDEICLELLVHTSARDTNAQDAIYREQGMALLNYMNRRMRQNSAANKMSDSRMLVQQTPKASEILVPETKSISESRALSNSGPSPAIADSILISADFGRKSRRTTSKSMTVGASIGSFTSATTSTASVLDAYKSRQPSYVRITSGEEQEDIEYRSASPIENVTRTPDANRSTESLVSPDSLKFKLRSPNEYLAKKRGLHLPAEESRPVILHEVLTERSPNKRRKPTISLDLTRPPKPLAITNLENSGTRLHPDGWLSSMAQLTSSSSMESMPKPLPSAETMTSKPKHAFLAPWPSSGHEPYTSHLVGTLALVASSERLRAVYRPKDVKRRIEPLERGYWHLHIPYSWSSADQVSFWAMLEEMIVEGKCGWGNWVEHITDPLDRPGSKEVSIGSQTDSAQKHVSEVKVWCWGEVVREIWLSLLMASRRQTLRLGMAWYDSCGNIVVQMR